MISSSGSNRAEKTMNMAGEVPEVMITCSGETFTRYVPVMGADSLSEFNHSPAVGIMGFPFPDGPDGGFFDTLRGIKIRFPHFQMDDRVP